MRSLRIALCQTLSDAADGGGDPRPANTARAIDRILTAKARGADIAIFGEVYLNGYRSDEALAKVSSRIDPADEHVGAIVEASKRTGVWVVMGLSRRGSIMPGNLFNSTILVSPTGIAGHYDKVHLANFVLPDGQKATEMIYWNTGVEYRVFDTPWCRVGLQICRDVRYPEASRVLTLMGAELIINSTAAPVIERSATWKVDHFSTTRAVENQVWFAMAGVLGRQRDMTFLGNSRIVSPAGEVVATIPDHEDAVLVHEVDLDDVAHERALSHCLDRRAPAAYRVITDPL